MMKTKIYVQLASEFVSDSDGRYQMQSLSMGGKSPYLVYISENDECAYLGVQYMDGTFGVIGGKFDSIVDGATDMIEMLQ